MVQVVLLLDVDFVPPEELSRIFSARQEYQSTLVYLYNNAVIVLPAFETLQGGAEGQQLALKLAKGDSTVPSFILYLFQGECSVPLSRWFQCTFFDVRAARYNTWLFTKLTPNGVVFSILFFSFYPLWLQLEGQFITGQAAKGQFQILSRVV